MGTEDTNNIPERSPEKSTICCQTCASLKNLREACKQKEQAINTIIQKIEVQAQEKTIRHIIPKFRRQISEALQWWKIQTLQSNQSPSEFAQKAEAIYTKTLQFQWRTTSLDEILFSLYGKEYEKTNLQPGENHFDLERLIEEGTTPPFLSPIENDHGKKIGTKTYIWRINTLSKAIGILDIHGVKSRYYRKNGQKKTRSLLRPMEDITYEKNLTLTQERPASQPDDFFEVYSENLYYHIEKVLARYQQQFPEKYNQKYPTPEKATAEKKEIFKYILAVLAHESHFDWCAISHTGAMGIGQFNSVTALQGYEWLKYINPWNPDEAMENMVTFFVHMRITQNRSFARIIKKYGDPNIKSYVRRVKGRKKAINAETLYEEIATKDAAEKQRIETLKNI
jgi:hypothetical protein